MHRATVRAEDEPLEVPMRGAITTDSAQAHRVFVLAGEGVDASDAIHAIANPREKSGGAEGDRSNGLDGNNEDPQGISRRSARTGPAKPRESGAGDGAMAARQYDALERASAGLALLKVQETAFDRLWAESLDLDLPMAAGGSR